MEIKVVGSENQVYQKQKLLGEGAFGKAYLVRRKADNELLVIKEMSIEHMSEQEKRETIKEAQILKNLNHPNITKFIEVYLTKQGKLKIVMEFAECGDLSKSISEHKRAKRHYDENCILDWFTQICLAIKHVHDRKILHRDIKGQNIFITKANTLKLGDFGIARVLNKTIDKARTVVGTPYYLSPEIIENKPYSFKSDIWSIGVLLYELCALTHPFTATSLQFLALKIVKGSYNPIPAQYSKQLRSLVGSMLSLDPSKRPGINDIFKNPLIQDRIRNFLTETKRDHEFSHTILHNHKVEILTNRLVQLKNQRDYSKERNRLKEEEERLKQALQKKRSQEKLKANQEREREIQRQRERQRSIEKQRQKEEEKRREFLEKQKQRREFERRQRMMEEQRSKEEQQKRMQREYEEQNKMAKYLEQKRKDQQELERLKRQYVEQMYQQEERQQQVRVAEKMRKNREKELEQQKKQMDHQQFARKQFFENQQIMRRVKERANQSEREEHLAWQEPESVVQKPKQSESQVQSCSSKKESPQRIKQSSDFRQRRSEPEPTEQDLQNALVNPNFKSSAKKPQLQHPQSARNPTSAVGSKWNKKQADNQTAKKHESVREQMKKDRERFMKGGNLGGKQGQDQIASGSEVKEHKDDKTVKGAKWQRPSSRGKEDSRHSSEKKMIANSKGESELIESAIARDKALNEILAGDELINDLGMLQKVSTKQKEEFDQYLLELEGILDNVNKRVSEAQENIANNPPKNLSKKSPNKHSSIVPAETRPSERTTTEGSLKENSPESVEFKQKLIETDRADDAKFVGIANMPVDEEVLILDDDDQNTLKLSLTADFSSQLPAGNEKEPSSEKVRIEESCDLDYFSSFSKLETLRMNLEDKFGTDNFVALYRFLEDELREKGLENFSDIYSMTDQITTKFPTINREALNSSFTLLLTLIHMEEKMISGNAE